MPILRIEKNRNYTTMSNYHLRDMRLKLKTIGLMSIMLSLPEDWDFSVKGLEAICNDGKSGIETALKELEVCGYLTRSYNRSNKGTFADVEYTLREYPITEKPISEKPISENRTQINTELTKYRLNQEDGYARARGDEAESNELCNDYPDNYPDNTVTVPPFSAKKEKELYAAPPAALRDPDYAEVSAEYQRNFKLQPMGVISDILGHGIQECGKEAVIYAIHKAKEAGAKAPYRYIEKVLLSMAGAGVTDAAGVEAYAAQGQQNQPKKPRKKTFAEIAAELNGGADG